MQQAGKVSTVWNGLCLHDLKQPTSPFDSLSLHYFRSFCELPLQPLVKYNYGKYSLAAMTDGAVFQALISCRLFWGDYRELRSFEWAHLGNQAATLKTNVVDGEWVSLVASLTQTTNGCPVTCWYDAMWLLLWHKHKATTKSLAES